MKLNADPAKHHPDIQSMEEATEPPDRLMAAFGPRGPKAKKAAEPTLLSFRVKAELKRWYADSTSLAKVDGVYESVLDVWRRMEHQGTYEFLPTVARVLFAMPTSSAHIERDFCVCVERS